MVFHENADKGDKMNGTGVWHNINDNDNYVKIDADNEQELEQEHVYVQEHGESSMDTSSSRTPRRSSRKKQPPMTNSPTYQNKQMD